MPGVEAVGEWVGVAFAVDVGVTEGEAAGEVAWVVGDDPAPASSCVAVERCVRKE